MIARVAHLVVVVAGVLLAATSASAYTVRAGDMLVRGVAGASMNPLRLDVATRETPAGGMLLGLDFDYAVDGEWSVASSLRPVLAPGFVDANLGVGAKYRVLQLQAPFIPYALAQVTTAVGAPLGYGDVHINVGARVGGGVDYFVMRDLAVGLEVNTELSGVFVPLQQLEWSTDVVAGISWRL